MTFDANSKGYVIVSKYFHQYASGCTGATRKLTIYLNNDSTFPTKKAAMAAAKAAGIKKMSVKGDDSPYGDVGAKERTVTFIKAKDMPAFMTEQYGNYKYPKYCNI